MVGAKAAAEAADKAAAVAGAEVFTERQQGKRAPGEERRRSWTHA